MACGYSVSSQCAVIWDFQLYWLEELLLAVIKNFKDLNSMARSALFPVVCLHQRHTAMNVSYRENSYFVWWTFFSTFSTKGNTLFLLCSAAVKVLFKFCWVCTLNGHETSRSFDIEGHKMSTEAIYLKIAFARQICCVYWKGFWDLLDLIKLREWVGVHYIWCSRANESGFRLKNKL